ncbi:MAG: hypothetical protein IPK73_23735 [Candidatus Obscuribacter sp.]|nr:hypothetical protein [Candidatus Obscuribacter sp.]MBK9277127.1 hypothetical protein [Candidatus Obscuribacter sp.]MBL8081516.1 hypothetical protein [Candidatus Obscuribacter sp.]
MSDYAKSIKDLPEVFQAVGINKDSHKAQVLLLTCIDFRFFDEVSDVIRSRKLCGDYDHVIVAGAELGPQIDFGKEPKPHWKQFFLDHLRLAKELHEIEQLLVLGHEDCGAYKRFLGPIDPDKEEEIHTMYLEKLKELIRQEGIDVKVDGFMLRNTVDCRN